MVGSSYDQKPYRRSMMQTWGATRPPLAQHAHRVRAAHSRPTPPGRWASPSPRRSRSPRQREDTNYALGSVLNHVLLHQTVIGQEAIAQMEMAGE